MYRVGIGQDSHSFDHGKPLVLGGLVIFKNNGLKANSDGDVILHSICNALSSAIGGNSLGTWADEMCFKGITDSKEYVKYIMKKVSIKNYQINNLSISIEAKTPYLSLKIIKKIKKKIAQLLKIKLEQLGITFTSGENLTSFGKGKGIQVLTIVSLKKND
jgi:2-C-methyl-D-erythritol 2,4-cyclodiphosphate synthase